MIGLNNALRVLGVNNIDIDAPLTGFLLLFRNQDVPGVIGRVGTLLGKHEINIANFALGPRAEFRRSHRHRQRGPQSSTRSARGIARDRGRASGASHRNSLDGIGCGDPTFRNRTLAGTARVRHPTGRWNLPNRLDLLEVPDSSVFCDESDSFGHRGRSDQSVGRVAGKGRRKLICQDSNSCRNRTNSSS